MPDTTKRYEQMLGAYELAQRVAFPVLLGMAGWLASGHMDQESRITRIEATRYTVQDARKDRDRAEAERRDMERVLIRLDSRTANIESAVGKIAARLETR